MARRKRSTSEQAQTKRDLGPAKSPALFLILWLAVPMVCMIGYAIFLRGGLGFSTASVDNSAKSAPASPTKARPKARIKARPKARTKDRVQPKKRK